MFVLVSFRNVIYFLQLKCAFGEINALDFGDSTINKIDQEAVWT